MLRTAGGRPLDGHNMLLLVMDTKLIFSKKKLFSNLKNQLNYSY